MKKLFASMIAAAFLLTGSLVAGATNSPTMSSTKKHSPAAKSTMTTHNKLAHKKHALKRVMARKLHRKHHRHSTKRHHI